MEKICLLVREINKEDFKDFDKVKEIGISYMI